MNVNGVFLNEEIREAIRSVAERDWDAFFKSIRDSELESFEQTPSENLLMSQARVRVVGELKTLIKQIRQSSKQ